MAQRPAAFNPQSNFHRRLSIIYDVSGNRGIGLSLGQSHAVRRAALSAGEPVFDAGFDMPAQHVLRGFRIALQRRLQHLPVLVGGDLAAES
jgi:hypothetical protein